MHQLSISEDKILLLTRNITKAKKVRSFFCLQDGQNSCHGARHFSKLAWETVSQPDSRIVITFSGSDGLKGIGTQAKHFLGPRVLFPHPPSYAACVLMGTAIFDHSIQLFRETLSEKITKLHKPIPKDSMGRRIELLHVLITIEI